MLLVSVLAIALSGRVRAAEPVVLAEDRDVVDLARHLDVLVDPTSSLTLEDVTAPEATSQWRVNRDEPPSYGVTNHAYWFRFTLKRPGESSSAFLVEVPYPGIDRVELFSGAGRQVAGDAVPYDQWPRRYRFPLFPVDAPAGGSRTFYMRVRTTGGTQVDPHLWRAQAFDAHGRAREIGLGIFYGTLAIMLLYNLFLYYLVRDRRYSSYVGYLAGMLGLTLSMDGTGYLYLWPCCPVVNNYAFPLFVAFSLCGGILFALSFLAVRDGLPATHKVGLALAGAAVLAGGLCVVSFAASVVALGVLSVISFAFMYGIGIVCWRRGVREAKLYLVGWSMLLVGLSLLLADKFGFVPPSHLTETTLRFGVVAEVLVFSFALANRINDLKRDRDAIEAVDRVKTRFFANVSHELRTPLMLILSPVQTLLERVQDADQRALLETVQANARRLLRQVNMLLEVVRLDEGRTRMRPVRGNLGLLLAEMVDAARPYAEGKGIELRAQRLDSIHDSTFDRARCEIVVGNLLSNALKFTPGGGVVTVRQASAGAGRIAFAVEDTGPGIPLADLARVFRRFERGRTAADDFVEGTGLGLALVKELVEAQGGAVSLHSTVGSGSSFRVELPAEMRGTDCSDEASRSADDQLAAQIERSADAHTLLADIGGVGPLSVAQSVGQPGPALPCVLVVEDHPALRAVVARALSATFHVETASNGREALDVARRVRPDAIVADVMMPEMDGLALLREVRSDPILAATPFLLATAKTDREDALAGLALGADDYVAKPFDVRELVSRVGAHLRARQLQRQLDDRDTRLAEIGRMTGRIVHDLRNPLSSIVVLCEITASQLQSLSVSPELSQNLALIDQAATRIETLTRQILEYARASSVELRRRPVRAAAFVRSLLRAWEPQLEKEAITLVTDIQVGDGDEVVLDPDRFARSVDNLIANAKEAILGVKGDAPPRTIEVAALRDGDTFLLRVADSGPGIDDAVRDVIFEPFVSAGKSMGTGLGLAIVAEVLRAHGGSIKLEGRGARGGAAFTLELPGSQ